MYHLCFPHTPSLPHHCWFHAGSTWKSISSSHSSEANCDQLEIIFELTLFSEQSGTRCVLMAHLYRFTESSPVLSRAFCCHLKPARSHTADCITLHKPHSDFLGVSIFLWSKPNTQAKSESMPPADSATCAIWGHASGLAPASVWCTPASWDAPFSASCKDTSHTCTTASPRYFTLGGGTGHKV